jgi:hypothetical protein
VLRTHALAYGLAVRPWRTQGCLLYLVALLCHSELHGAYEKRPMALPNVIFSISLMGNDFFSESLSPRVAFDVSGNGQAKAELLSLLDRFECPS